MSSIRTEKWALDTEPLRGPHRTHRLNVIAAYDRMMKLLEYNKHDGWAQGWMVDSHTYGHYEMLHSLITDEEEFDMEDILLRMEELLDEFNPAYEQEGWDDDEEPRVYCADHKRRAEMHAEKAALLAVLAGI